MFKLLLKIIIIAGVFTIILQVVPVTFTDKINNSFIYFLSYIKNLDIIVDTASLLLAMQIFVNIQIGVGVLLIFHGLLSKFTS